MAHAVDETLLTAPMQFVLLAARAGAGDAQAAQELARALDDGAPAWSEVLANAFHHRVFPLVTEGLERGGPGVIDKVPSQILEELRAGRRENALRAILISLEAQRLIVALRELDLETSVLKGTPLSAMLYGDPSMRHVGDLDLLFAGGERPPAELMSYLERLSALGYHATNPTCHLTPKRLASYGRFWKDMTLESTRGGSVVELHWRLFNNRLHGANRLMRAGVAPWTVYGTTIPALPRVEQFVYAAAHGCSDEWVYFKGLVDIATFLRVLSATELDRAFALAGELGLEEQLSSAIHLARLWLGASTAHRHLLPASNRFHRIMLERLITRLRATNFRPERQQLSAIDALRLELRLVPGVRTVVEVIERFLWRPRIWSAYDLPDRWFWLYPVLGCMTLPRTAVVKVQT